MTRYELVIEVPEDGSGPFSTSLSGAGDFDATLPVLLLALESTTAQYLRQIIEEENPLYGQDLVNELATTQARLRLIHEVLHLPVTNHNGIVTTI